MEKDEKYKAVIPTVGHAKRRAYATADAYLEKHMRRILDEYAAGAQHPLDETAQHIGYLVQKQARRHFRIDNAAFRMVMGKRVRASRPNEAQSPPRYVNAEPEKSSLIRRQFQRLEKAIRSVIEGRRDAPERTKGSRDFGLGDYRPKHDALYRQIAAAVPAWLDNHLHDDVISEVYLAILDGTISTSEVSANADRFARAARNAFTSKWGNRSLDEKRFHDSEATIGSTIPDPSALAAFDYIFEEAL